MTIRLGYSLEGDSSKPFLYSIVDDMRFGVRRLSEDEIEAYNEARRLDNGYDDNIIANLTIGWEDMKGNRKPKKKYLIYVPVIHYQEKAHTSPFSKSMHNIYADSKFLFWSNHKTNCAFWGRPAMIRYERQNVLKNRLKSDKATSDIVKKILQVE